MPISATGSKAEHGFTSLKRSAEHGLTSSRRSAEHGFTLIELMVVIAVIGIVSATVMLNIPDPQGRLLDEAERLAARSVAARDEAIMTARDVRLTVTSSGYGFDRRSQGQWVPISEKPLALAHWPQGMQANAAEIIFDSTGMTEGSTPILIKRGDNRQSVHFETDGAIRINGE